MAGAHTATVLALLGLALTCALKAFDLLSANPPSTTAGAIALLASVCTFSGALVVAAHARGTTPNCCRKWLDDLVGVPRHYVPQPDIELLGVVRRIVPGPISSEGTAVTWRNPGDHQRVGNALRSIREQARLGNVRVWGRLDATEGHEDATPRSPIPAEFWERGDIGYLDFLGYTRGQAVDESKRNNHVRYLDLYLDQREVDRVWPSNRARLRLRTPWHRV